MRLKQWITAAREQSRTKSHYRTKTFISAFDLLKK
jgi:hypothetical protein